MRKSPDAFRSIGEVAALIGVAPHVLRYWEQQFTQLSPVKRADGRRYYRPDDLHLAAGLVEVLREDGLTIRGAQRLMAPDKGAAVRARGTARLSRAAGTDTPPPAPAPAPTPTAPSEPWLARLARSAARLRALPAPIAPQHHAEAAVLAQKLRDLTTA